MPNINIQITNLPQIRAAFNKAPMLMTRELGKAIGKTVLYIKGQEVKQYSSLGIGIITRGLITSIQRGQYMSGLRGEVGPNVTGSPGVPYALFVHSGTRYMSARPFLKNAVDESAREVDLFFTEAVNNVLSEIGRIT